MSKIAIVGVILIGAAVVAEKSLEIPISRLTLRAIDEEGKPVSGATVKMSFEEAFNWSGRGNIVYVTGITDADGKFSGEGHSLDTKGGRIQKAGYYSSYPESYKFREVIAGKWRPWNPTLEVVLKKIVNPIPMYARRLQIEIPSTTQQVGFDLTAGDWVAPYGKGTNSDFLFALNRKFEDRRNYEAAVTITFSNRGDGLQSTSVEDVNSGSELKLPRTAPDEGYGSKLATSIGATKDGPGHEDAKANRSYFFRVRTVLNEDGKVESALYGKIDGEFQLDAINSKTCILLFTYYLNPSANDRNVEFDPKRNLFPELNDDESVSAP
jgi:hypothetical protein